MSRKKSSTWALLLGLFLLACPARLSAAVKQELSDEYLKNQFDWVLYLNTSEMPSYLNYKGSRLNPLTRVRVYVRRFDRASSGSSDNASQNSSQSSAEAIKVYEDFWYQHGHVIGMRRYQSFKPENQQVGAIISGAYKENTYNAPAATDAIVRLIADINLKNAVASAVFTPDNQYNEIAANLAHYNFIAQMNSAEGMQMSLHLQTTSGTRDEYFYLKK